VVAKCRVPFALEPNPKVAFGVATQIRFFVLFCHLLFVVVVVVVCFLSTFEFLPLLWYFNSIDKLKEAPIKLKLIKYLIRALVTLHEFEPSSNTNTTRVQASQVRT
jgi:hypothetical protein